MTRPAPIRHLVVVVLLVAGACGSEDDDAAETSISGRVTSRTDAQYCLTPDRGTTVRCVPVAAAAGAVEVGQCVTMTPGPTPEAHRLEVVDEAACAAGDLGDGSGG